MEVRHVSLNHGDLNDAVSGRVSPGGVLGSDIVGEVGAFAVQLAAAGGAYRIAAVGSAARTKYVTDLGVKQVVIALTCVKSRQ